MTENHILASLPAPVTDMPARNLPVPADVYRASGFAPEPDTAAVPVPLSHYLWILRRNWWKILLFVACSVTSTMVVSSRLVPIYESTATVDIDRQMPSAIIGQEATRTVANDSDQFLATQAKLIQSDSVLRPVAEQFRLLETDAERPDTTAGTSDSRQDAPVRLKNLKVARPPNTYLLLISYRSADSRLAADVANGIARSYLEHTYDIRYKSSASLSAFMEKQMEELKAKMERSSAALAQFETDQGVINPEEKTSILSARLLQLNTEFTTAQGDRVRKQAAADSVKSGTLEAAQASTQGEQLRKLADRLDEAREKFAGVKTQYGANHPEYQKTFSQVTELERQFASLRANVRQRVNLEYQEAANRENMLKKAVAEIKVEFDQLNARSFEYKAVKREADADKGLYDELVHKIKEAGINSSFQNSSIRLSDSARPPLRPIFPDLPLNAGLALVFATVLAVGAAIMADVLDNTVRDPEQIQRGLKTEVLGSLPVVKSWLGRLPLVSNNGNGSKALVKSGGRHSGQDPAFEEAIRTLRDSILLSDLGRRPRSESRMESRNVRIASSKAGSWPLWRPPDFTRALLPLPLFETSGSLPSQDFTTGSEPRTSVFKPRWICSGSRTLLSRTSAKIAAPMPRRLAKRNARIPLSHRPGKTGSRGGRAVSDMRMELFWKLELIPASLILCTSSV